MNEFIEFELTDGRKCYVNMNNVLYMYESTEGDIKYTRIVFNTKCAEDVLAFVCVKESYKDVLDKMNHYNVASAYVKTL